MKCPIRKVLSITCLALTLALFLTLGVGGSSAGEFRRFPEHATEASGEVDVAELKKLLRQAEALQKAEPNDGREIRSGKKRTTPGRFETPGRFGTPAKVVSDGEDLIADDLIEKSPDANPAVSAAAKADEPGEPGEKGAAGSDTEDEDAADAESEKPREPVVHAGCMYRGDHLIWEKVPGTCKP
jgi:hypothetical protein